MQDVVSLTELWSSPIVRGPTGHTMNPPYWTRFRKTCYIEVAITRIQTHDLSIAKKSEASQRVDHCINMS
jgi:hypothetical protein